MTDGTRHDEYLAAHGWREGHRHNFDSHDRVWYKRVPSPTSCQLNQDKPGVQVSLKQWDHGKHYPVAKGHVGYQLELQGECLCGRDIHLQTSIGDDELPEVLESQVERLRTLWEAANIHG
jgi:hypothetical protein